MDGLTIFQYEGQDIRTVEQNGAPWWVLSDVCKVLGLGTPAKVAQRLDDDEKGVTLIHTPGGKQQTTIINEPGLYSVILRSKKPEAKAFKRWITHEVLPAIRKTGRYDAGGQADQLQALTAEVRRLSDQVGAMVAGRPLLPLPSPFLLADAEKQRWLKKFNAKMTIIESDTGQTRRQLLHDLYTILEQVTGKDLDLERMRCIEQTGASDCTVLEAVYHEKTLRTTAQRLIDQALDISPGEW